MSMVLTLILVVQMLSALGMIGLILIQQGKGADMGAAFGSGGSGSLFGATGGANFLSRTTAVLAALFFTCTLLLAYFSNARSATPSGSVLEGAALTAPATTPSAPNASSTAAQIPGNTPAAKPDNTVPPASGK
jgi:preprotein translocase subunit SecG